MKNKIPHQPVLSKIPASKPAGSVIMALALTAAASAQTYVLDFEDLAVGSSDGNPIATGPAAGHYALDDDFAPTPGREFFRPGFATYHGFTFDVSPTGPDSNPPGPAGSWFYTNLLGSGYNLAKSGTISVGTEGICSPLANGNCTVLETVQKPSLAITSPTPFRFDGAWFASPYAQTSISYVFFLDGDQVHEQGSVVVNPNIHGFYGPTWIPSGYGLLVDTMYVVGLQGRFGMDDFTYSLVAIPEPSAPLLLGSSLALLLIRRRP